MSINFNAPVNEETRDLLRGAFGKSIANDGKHFLYDKLPAISGPLMKEVARTAGQTAELELNTEGDVKKLSDGTRYMATTEGWQKLPAKA